MMCAAAWESQEALLAVGCEDGTIRLYRRLHVSDIEVEAGWAEGAHHRAGPPRADTSAFKALLQQFDQVLKNKDANPAAVFSDTVQMTLAGGHPRVRPLSAEMLQELNLDEMLAIYRERFADLGDFTFLFVGNVDLDRFNGSSLPPTLFVP